MEMHDRFRLFLVAAIAFPCLANATPPSATVTGGKLQIVNDNLAISLDARSGSILSVVDTTSGIDLVSVQSGVYHALWGVNLATTGSGSEPFADNNSSGVASISTSNSASDASATLVWQGLNFNSGQKIPGATMTVKISVAAGDPLSHWTFDARSIGGIPALQLQFPLIGGVGTLGTDGADNLLLVPEQGGRLFKDPIGTRKNFAPLYPSSYMSMQFEAFYNSKAGFYLAAHDTMGQSKAISWYSPPTPGNSALWAAYHFFPNEAASNLVLPYEVVLGTFHGDWTKAADLYKTWAREQSWARETAAKVLPNSFRNAQFGRGQCVHNCSTFQSSATFADVVKEQAYNYSAFGGSSLIFVSGWEKLGAWFSGDDVPPFEGWSAFDQMIAGLHQQGNYVNLFNGVHKLDDVTPLYKSGAATANLARDKTGVPFTEVAIIGGITHTRYVMTPGTEFWTKNLTNTATSLAAHGVDIIQFDGYPISDAVLDDYSEGHPPGRGGTWQWTAWKTMLQTVEQAGLAINSDLAFSTEEGHELLLPLVTYFMSRDLSAEFNGYSKEGTPVPVFGYVYKPFAQTVTDYWPSLTKGKAESFHQFAFARALIWGQRLPITYGYTLSPGGNLPPTTQDYYKATGAIRAKYARFLIDGSMLPAPSILSPVTSVEVQSDGFAVPDYSGVADAIQVGAWRSRNGEIGIVLTNIGSSDVSFDLPLEFARLGLVKGTFYAALIETDGVSRSLGTISSSSSFPLVLGSLRIAVITLQPLKTVFEFYNTNLDNYFITADAGEAAAIDSGSAGPGWRRTDSTFRADGSMPVCRFYGSISPGPNSHFYTVDPAECDSLKQIQANTPATQKRWNFESLDFFSTPATNGTCPSDIVPVYRAYNNGFTRGVDSNHRITSSLAAIQEVVTRGWSNEGVVMCAPK